MKKLNPSTSSLFGLNWMIFFLSDVRPGIGPFLSIYLRSYLNWSTDLVGIALGTTDLTASICQIPSGLLVDSVKAKRFILFLACLCIALACSLIISFPTFYTIVFAQALIGISAAIIPPSIASITLGLVGREKFPKRISLNETWSHAGNVVTAAIVGILSYLFGLPWIVYLVVIFATLSSYFMTYINPAEIHHDIARELNNGNNGNEKAISIAQYLKTSPLLLFCCSVFLFHFSNAAQLPLIGQLLSSKNASISSIFMGACIILAQLVMIVIAYSMGFWMNKTGRKPLFLLGLMILPLRAILYTLTENPILLLCIQLLDGIGAGIFGVIGIVTISDIAKGTGRFNFSVGLMALFQGIGASFSNIFSGIIVSHYGFNTGFFTLAFIGLIGIAFYGLLMPETKVEAK